MNTWAHRLLTCVVSFSAICPLGFALAIPEGATPSVPSVALEPLADGVWRAHAPGSAPGGLNAMAVEREDGLLVVDTLGSPEAAAAFLQKLEARGLGPVRYLVLTHAHADAAGGASAFPPSALVIAAQKAFDAMADPGADLGGEARARAESPSTWSAPPRRLPVLSLPGPVRFEDARNAVEIIPVYGGHTPGDLIVRLERAGLIAVGDVVAGDRNPWAGDADLASWISTLNALSKLQPETVVPLRGEPMDARSVRLQREAFSWTKAQVESGFVDLVPSGRIPERVLAREEIARYFDPGARPSFADTVVDAAMRVVRRERQKRGLPN